MLFCCGVGAGVLYWGFIEWGYYFQAPPLGLEYGTWQAGEMAPAYGFFHWGPTAWAIYAVSACTFGYIMFVRKSNVLKCSEGCRGLLGKKVDGPLGKVIDVFFIFGIVGAVPPPWVLPILWLQHAFAPCLESKPPPCSRSSSCSSSLPCLVSALTPA